MSNFRLSVPATAKRGELFAIRLIIQHPMETGFRLDAAGKAYAKNVIHDIACRYNGVEVMRMELSSGIAANPYLEFFARAEASGEVLIDWLDDGGEKGQALARIVVA
jgi:sulfur-oxidizing protein SoxZ